MTDSTTKSVVVALTGHEMNERLLTVQVPADWTDEDIQSLPLEELDWCGEEEWDVVDGGVTLHCMRIEQEETPAEEPDAVFEGDPADHIAPEQFRLRLARHVGRRMNDTVRDSAGEALKELLSTGSEEVKDELMRLIFRNSEDWSVRIGKQALGMPSDAEVTVHDLLERFQGREQAEALAKKTNWKGEGF